MGDLKEPLSYSEQVSRLAVTHNVTIDDKDHAIEILKKVGYYRLSAYGIGLKQPNDKEKYVDGTSINTLYRLYQFDSRFKNSFVYVIEQIEIQLRAQISNHLALTYGSEAHGDKGNFVDKLNREGTSIYEYILNNFNRECDRHKNNPFVKHHMNKYGGHFPIWAAIELFSFGNLASLYDIMKPDDRKAIAELYNTQANHLSSWILSLVEIRNICAHYGRLYNMPLSQIPFLYSEHKKYRKLKNNKVFPAVLVIKRMLNGDERWNSFAEAMDALLDEYSDVVNLSFMGFPFEWKKVLMIQ